MAVISKEYDILHDKQRTVHRRESEVEGAKQKMLSEVRGLRERITEAKLKKKELEEKVISDEYQRAIKLATISKI